MRSVSSNKQVAAACLLTAGALGAVAGCTSTQQTASRLRVKNTRILAARKPVVVNRTDPDVKVMRATLLRGQGAAVAVVLRNVGHRTVNDLPLSVGVRGAGGKVTYLNRKVSSYFEGHAPALGPSQTTTWVYTTPEPLKAAGAVVAKVGMAPAHPLTVARQLPKLEVTGTGPPGRGGSLKATVTNSSDVTQYDVAVYAAASKGGRVVAGGQGSVVKVDPGTTATVPLKLIGNARGATVSVYAEPTIFE